MTVYTKKVQKAAYHLATFNEPLTELASAELPAHVIEEPLPEPDATEREAPSQQ